MPSPKLTALITALLFMAGTHGATAAYNLQQLQEIERYIATKNCGALLGYLQQNPSIMSGNDLLAQELRSFANGVEGGIISCLSAPVSRAGPLANSAGGAATRSGQPSQSSAIY